jgi:sugar phosphate isomerase/epimerase
MNFPVKPVVTEIERAASMGMDYLELAMDPPRAHFSRLAARKKRIGAALRRNGLGLVCHLPTFVYTAHLAEGIRNASVREVIASLETAADLGAEKAVIHPGYIDGLAIHVVDEAMAYAMESLDQFIRRAGELGIALCLENLFSRLGPYVEPDDFAAVFETFPQLLLTLDTGHAHMGDARGTRIEAFIHGFGRRLAHVHVSDNLGHSDDHLPVGGGTVPFESVVRALASAGYDETITLEIFCEDSRAVIESRRALERLFAQAAAT